MSEYVGEYVVSLTAKTFTDLRFHRHEEIVRCRDCAYILQRKYNNELEYHTCSYFDSEYAEIEPDGFCAWACRKDDAQPSRLRGEGER